MIPLLIKESIYHLFLFFLSIHQIFLSFFLNIQVEMADAFRSDGKIYVVVLVALIILVGIFFYLFRIEGKIKDINKNK